MKRIVVMISGSGSNLQTLIEQIHLTDVDAEIVGVIANKPDAYGLTRAENAGIANVCVDSSLYANDRVAYDQLLISTIEQYQPDLIVLAGFMRILTADFVERFAGRLLNIHPSLLPLYTGLNTHQRALDNGDTHAGATVHFVTGELDGGPPVLQARVPIKPGDDAHSLAARVLAAEHQIYPVAVNWHMTGRLKLIDGALHKDGVPLPATGHVWEEPL